MMLAQDDAIASTELDAIVQQHCRAATLRGVSWRVLGPDERDGWWIDVRHPEAQYPRQGWKLHVSATPLSADAVLERALPVLFAEKTTFKIIASRDRLHALNQGESGLSQIGKCITVYPSDDAQAVRLAIALDAATRGLRGPAIPSDRPLASGSLVYYRYGGFDWQQLRTIDGASVPAITAPDGTLMPDRREPGLYAPPWAIDPFVAAGVAAPLPALSPLLNSRFLIVTTISSSARGTVARGLDIQTRQRCILKRAAHDTVLDASGADARDYLRRGADLLHLLRADPRFPAVFDLFSHGDDLILSMEDIPGITLAQHVLACKAAGHSISIEQLGQWARELTQLLAVIHMHNHVYGDLAPTNVIVTPDRRVRLIDFDAVYDQRSVTMPSSLGTPGYMSPQYEAGQRPAISDDVYALGSLLLFMATAASPTPATLEQANVQAAPEPALVAHPMLSEIIAACRDVAPQRRFRSMGALDDALAALHVDQGWSPA